MLINNKWLAGMMLTAGVALSGSAAMAQEPYWQQPQPDRDMRYDRQDLRYDRRDLHHDYDRIARIQADIARDRAQLNEDIRCGRQYEAANDARDLARDQRMLDAQTRDIRRDQRDMYYDRQDLRRDSYYRGW